MPKFGYARVSTRAQSLDLQLDALKAAGCETIFSEKVSGTAGTRPELKACLEAIQEGDELVVWRLDRLGRSLVELVNTVAEIAKKEAVLVSLQENIDTQTLTGRTMLNLFGMMAELERDLIRERVQAAKESARARGTAFGRPRKLDADDLIEAEHLRLSGLSIGRVASLKNVSKATLQRYRREAKKQRLKLDVGFSS
jgi:DNA invertase Pin-like site-specific DNA recombinase